MFHSNSEFPKYHDLVLSLLSCFYWMVFQAARPRCNSPLHSVPNGMKSQTWKFFRLLRKIQIHQQTKGLILIFYYQFNQVVVIKSEEITNISSKFNKNTVLYANPLDLILKIT